MAAFEQLKAEGYVEGRMGSGTCVSKVLPEKLIQVPTAAAREVALPRRRSLSKFGRRVRLFENYEEIPTRAFRTNLPALDLFPVEAWAQTNARSLREVTAVQLRGSDALGYLPLRKSVADYLNTTRGVNCQAEHVAIVSGVQEALDLSARLFLDEGDRVMMEDPGYPGAERAFTAAGARIRPVTVDDEGMKLSDLKRVRLVYVTPAHQFPLGTTMSLRRRLALLEKAQQAGALVFEDDYDSEFRYAGRPVPALQGLDRHGVVLFAGSFSKVMFPSLRLGYLVVPGDLVDRVAAAKSVSSRHAPLLEQVTLYRFMNEGLFARHVRRMRQVYGERLAVLLESARRELGGLLEISEVEAGLQTVGWLARGLGGERAAQAAAARKVDVVPLSRYALRPLAREGIHLGFAAIRPHEIRRGMKEMAAALSTVAR